MFNIIDAKYWIYFADIYRANHWVHCTSMVEQLLELGDILSRRFIALELSLKWVWVQCNEVFTQCYQNLGT